ncbi:unnamed protein product [Cercospora beticola]|nr:unnamed protein product [Cercospora beticola]
MTQDDAAPRMAKSTILDERAGARPDAGSETPTSHGRKRFSSGLSGSTQYTTLKVPGTSYGEKGSSASSIFSHEVREDALRPDPSTEKDFEVKDNKFAFSPGQLNKLLNPKSLGAYAALGGIKGIERGLQTSRTGLSVDESRIDANVSFEEATQYEEKTRSLTHNSYKRVATNSSGHNLVSREWITTGQLDGMRVEALADSCAGNFISEAYLSTRGIPYGRKNERHIVVGNGQKAFKTLATVRLPWEFGKETHTKYIVDFDIIPARFCEYAVTLGGKFLAATKILTERFKDRILRRSRLSAMPRLFYQGGSHVRLKGYCEGVKVAALADTCSDLDLLSPEMLAELGYEHDDILTDVEHRVFVELPGGLITRTSAMVRDVEFRFGDGRFDDSYIRNFYILPGLPAGVLIGDDFLWQSDAFSKYSEHLIDIDDEDLWEDVPEGMFLNIKLVEQKKSWWSRLRRHAVDNADAEALIQWQTQCKGVLDEIEAVHYKDIPLDARKDEILKLEQRYRALVQKPPTPVASASETHKQRRAPASSTSRAMA